MMKLAAPQVLFLQNSSSNISVFVEMLFLLFFILRNFVSLQKGIEEEKVTVARNLIGSRPPKCEKKCRSCERCEAIQVPVTKVQAQGRKKSHHFSAVSYVNVRGDDISNYKPMSWKCKCGSLIFDPS